MRDPKPRFRLALIISILFGIVLPLISGMKNLRLSAVIFTFAWLVYAVIFFPWVFLITGRKNLRERLQEGITDKWGYSLAVSFPPNPRPNTSS